MQKIETYTVYRNTKGNGNMIKTVGSVCSGIEAASVAWEKLGVCFKWFSEIAKFPSMLLNEKYPSIPNLGDMNDIPDLLLEEKIDSPDLICGGTPCQAFSLAGLKNGLKDNRGNLTLKFVDIINANDEIRSKRGLLQSIVFWENVEGVLTDNTNAFGCFVSFLAGLKEEIKLKKWPSAGLIRGKKRNIAWRVLDAKFFGVPQQRRRLYLIAGGRDFKPENVLFEPHNQTLLDYPKETLFFEKEGHQFTVFREYTDCLYAAYGTKWNGNAAANNGSLFVVQDNIIRRLSPLECERLMGFPDNYTNLPNAKKTNRYQAIGNSWAVPVVRWIGLRLINGNDKKSIFLDNTFHSYLHINLHSGYDFFNLGKEIISASNGEEFNCSAIPEHSKFGSIKNIISFFSDDSIFISPVGCFGILRRAYEKNIKLNQSLEKVLTIISSQMDKEEINRRSLVQRRGKRCGNIENNQLSFFV